MSQFYFCCRDVCHIVLFWTALYLGVDGVATCMPKITGVHIASQLRNF